MADCHRDFFFTLPQGSCGPSSTRGRRCAVRCAPGRDQPRRHRRLPRLRGPGRRRQPRRVAGRREGRRRGPAVLVELSTPRSQAMPPTTRRRRRSASAYARAEHWPFAERQAGAFDGGSGPRRQGGWARRSSRRPVGLGANRARYLNLVAGRLRDNAAETAASASRFVRSSPVGYGGSTHLRETPAGNRPGPCKGPWVGCGSLSAAKALVKQSAGRAW
jgi:hypothetical protein